MNNSLLQDLKVKVFQSGNPLYFYIGINVIVFVITAFVSVLSFLFGFSFNVSDLIREYLAFPAALPKIPYRVYTVFTYMFFHQDVFHILFNMLWLYWMGNIFLEFLNKRQFHFVYMVGGFAGAAFFALGYNIFPVFSISLISATIIGASAAVMAIITAAATLTPNYSIRLLFLGDVKIKYLAIAYFVLDIIGIAQSNPGGSFAHIGGAILGFVYIKQLQSGNDWSKLFMRKSPLKVIKNDTPVTSKSKEKDTVSQQEIDAILDKISKTGYDKLTAEEKAKLFKASNNK